MKHTIQHITACCAPLLVASSLFAQCEFDVCGYWYSENYNSGVPVEYLSIDLVGDLLVCTKVLGDPYVPTGNITWQGVPTGCTFPGEAFGTFGVGQPIFPVPCMIQILSDDHIALSSSSIAPLTFFRTNTDYMESQGIDYSNFPVSCFECPSAFPNVFTPNGDGVNDLLEPICSSNSHLFSITDRWGITVFETRDPKPIWDGRNGWTPCPAGVYFWSMIKADDRTGKIAHGLVQLIR